MHLPQIVEKSKTKFKTGVKWLVWSGIIALVGVGGWFLYIRNFNKSSEFVAVPIVPVKLDNVEITINEGGTVELGGQQSVKSPGEVAVERVLVKLGDRVGVGQQLLTLRNQQRQNNLAEQELKIDKQQLTLTRSRQKVVEAQDKLANAQREIREPIKQQLEIREQELNFARSREKLTEAKEKLASEKKKLEDLQVLAAKGFIPGNELQSKQDEVRAGESSLKDAQLEVSSQSLKLQRVIVEQQRSSELQEKVLTSVAELREAQSTVNTETRELQLMQVERERIAKELQNNFVIAPISGKVLDIKVKNGEGVKAGDVLLTLGNPAEELVKLELGTLDASKVKVKQLARIKVIGPDAKEFTGQVQSLHPQAIASESGGSLRFSSSSGQAKVPATVQLHKPSGSLIPGSQVSVEIIVQQRLKVVAVNIEAIQRTEPKPFVWIKDSQSKAQKRTVTLGLEGATKVEVKSGLQPGDKIILPLPDTLLEPGKPVTEAPSGGSPISPDLPIPKK
jgi:HlyD family secretion protein